MTEPFIQVCGGKIKTYLDGSILKVQTADGAFGEDCCCFLDPSTPTWVTDHNFSYRDLCEHDTKTYRCITPHKSAAINEPNVGADWQLYWLVASTIQACGNSNWNSYPPFGGPGRTPKYYSLTWYAAPTLRLLSQKPGNSCFWVTSYGSEPVVYYGVDLNGDVTGESRVVSYTDWGVWTTLQSLSECQLYKSWVQEGWSQSETCKDYHQSSIHPAMIKHPTHGDVIIGSEDDLTPPTPNPPTWKIKPRYKCTDGPFIKVLEMEFNSCSDLNNVEYKFECLSNHDYDGCWTTSPRYEVHIGVATGWQWRGKARDLSMNLNETDYSTTETGP